MAPCPSPIENALGRTNFAGGEEEEDEEEEDEEEDEPGFGTYQERTKDVPGTYSGVSVRPSGPFGVWKRSGGRTEEEDKG